MGDYRKRPYDQCINSLTIQRIVQSKFKSMNKVYADANAALFDLNDGSSIMAGRSDLFGIPENCIAALVQKK